MISLKKYLDSVQTGLKGCCEPDDKNILPVAIAAYGAALLEMGSYSLDACPALGVALKQKLLELKENLSVEMSRETIEATERNVHEQLQDWSRRTATHYQQKTREVKELLLVMARTAESVGERDQRCAGQINEVTARLKAIASLEDLTEIRVSIEKSAAELRASVARMTADGKAAIEQLGAEVTNYQVILEKAEEIASRDALTGLRSRMSVESQIERRISAGSPLCVAIIDIDQFKNVNDEHGHLVGDELLKQFASELQTACRSTDRIGRWGGDEFITLLNCGLSEASAQTDRIRKWVCGNYTAQGKSGPLKLRVDASIGLAEHTPGENMKELLARADADMYERKAVSRAVGTGSRR